MVTVLEGAADISIAEEIHRVAAGEMITMPANIPHALKANVPFKMLLRMIRA